MAINTGKAPHTDIISQAKSCEPETQQNTIIGNQTGHVGWEFNYPYAVKDFNPIIRFVDDQVNGWTEGQDLGMI